jgi:hypothetical protein
MLSISFPPFPSVNFLSGSRRYGNEEASAEAEIMKIENSRPGGGGVEGVERRPRYTKLSDLKLELFTGHASVRKKDPKMSPLPRRSLLYNCSYRSEASFVDR